MFNFNVEHFCIISFFQVLIQFLNFSHIADEDEEKQLVGLWQAASRRQKLGIPNSFPILVLFQISSCPVVARTGQTDAHCEGSLQATNPSK